MWSDKHDEDEQGRYEGFWGMIWGAWLFTVAISFAILEGIALARRRRGDTLSERTRHWLGISKRKRLTAGAVGLGAVLVGFVAWFWPHIVLEIW